MRAIVLSGSGSVHAALAERLSHDGRIHVVRHASGRANVELQMRGFAPDLVLIHDMQQPLRAVARVSEIRRAAPGAAVIVLTERLEGAWLTAALRLGATVLPADIEQLAFEQVLAEILAAPASTVINFPRLKSEPRPLVSLESHPEGSAA